MYVGDYQDVLGEPFVSDKMGTPTKYTCKARTVTSDTCYLCDEDFKVAGRTTKWCIQPAYSRSSTNYARLINEVLGIDLNDRKYKPAKMCNPCKMKLDHIRKYESIKTDLYQRLSVKVAEDVTRVKRCAKSTPTPKKERDRGGKRPNIGTKCSKSLFDTEKEITVLPQPSETIQGPSTVMVSMPFFKKFKAFNNPFSAMGSVRNTVEPLF